MDAHESDSPRSPYIAGSNDETGSLPHIRESHGRSRSHWGLSTAVHGVGFVAKKMVSNRLTDSLWSLKKSSSTSSSHVPSDASSSIPNAKRDNLPHEAPFDQTSKPPLSVADEHTAKLHVSNKPTDEKQKKRKDVFDESENPKPPDDSHVRPVNKHRDQSENSKPPDDSHAKTTISNVIYQSENLKHPDASHIRLVNQHRRPSTTGSNVTDQSGTPKHPNSSHVKLVNQHQRWPGTTGPNVNDQSENSKPLDASHVRLVNQHRWPTTTGSNVLDHSETSKPPDGSHVKPATQQLWPGTVGSNVLSKNINPPEEVSKTTITPEIKMSLPSHASKPLQESSSDATTLPSSSSHVDNDKSKIDKSERISFLSNESQPPSPKKSYGLSSRGVSPSPASRGASLIPKSIRGISITPSSRGVSLTPSSRGVSLVPTARRTDPSSVRGNNPIPRGVSPSISDKPISPTHVARGVSPTPIRPSSPRSNADSEFTDSSTRRGGSRVRGASPTPSKAPNARTYFSATAILSMFTNSRKEKIMEEHKEAAQYLELLQNIQVQWQFLNADTEAAMDLQRETAEKSLFDMWKAILELRDSVAVKKIDITLSILQLKLYAVLYRQMANIDEWASIEKEHESALSVTVKDLVTRSLQLPITTGGVKVKADIKLLKFAVCSSVQVMQTTVSSIQSTLSKLDKTRYLASELANVTLDERALLDECEFFLASAAPLQIEECSLRSQLIQSTQT